MTMRAMRVLLCCGLLGLLSGCATSVHPLCDPAMAEPDKRLVGMWVEHDDKVQTNIVTYVHFAREPQKPLDKNREVPEPGLMRCWTIDHDAHTSVGGQFSGGRFFCTRIGNSNYSSLVLAEVLASVDDSQRTSFEQSLARFADVPGYSFVKYEVSDDQLVIWPTVQDQVAKSIVDKEIAGIAKKRKVAPGDLPFPEWEQVELTASTEELRAFIAAGRAEKWFSDDLKTVLRRLR